MVLETSPLGMVGAAGRKQVVITVSMGRLVIQDNRKSSWISHEQRTYFSHELFLASAPTPACSPCLGHTVRDEATGQDPLAGISVVGSRSPRRLCATDKTVLPNTPKFKRRGRDDIHPPKHTFLTPDFEYKKIPMLKVHEILV